MKELAVLIPYRSRFENFKVLIENLMMVDKTSIDFHLISLGDSDPRVKKLCNVGGLIYHYLPYTDVFSIGVAHNYGATISKSEYILKQDVDCLPFAGLYNKILSHILTLRSNQKSWSNIGFFYCNKEFSITHLNGIISNDLYEQVKNNDNLKETLKYACGNNFLVNREHFLKIGGCSQLFKGWGWEDYQVLYFLEKYYNPNFSLSEYKIDSITQKCRDEIARPKNQITNQKNIIFLHKWHDPMNNESQYMSFVETNKLHLLYLVSNLKRDFL